jgi:hypothetical protein
MKNEYKLIKNLEMNFKLFFQKNKINMRVILCFRKQRIQKNDLISNEKMHLDLNSNYSFFDEK